jgi:hypothetical protein
VSGHNLGDCPHCGRARLISDGQAGPCPACGAAFRPEADGSSTLAEDDVFLSDRGRRFASRRKWVKPLVVLLAVAVGAPALVLVGYLLHLGVAVLEPALTPEKYQKLRPGMSLAEVSAVLGWEGEESSSLDLDLPIGRTQARHPGMQKSRVWRDSAGHVIGARFEGDRAVSYWRDGAW